MPDPYPQHGSAQRSEVGLGQLLDVHILEGDHPYVLDEPSRPVHVPHPGVLHGELEEDLTVRIAHLQVNGVGEVEAPLGFHDVGEQPHHVAVLAIELKLHLGLVLFEILRAHPRLAIIWLPSSAPVMTSLFPTDRPAASSAASSAVTSNDASSTSVSPCVGSPAAAATLTYENRCSGQGPCSRSAAPCSGVTYPL